MPVPAAATTTSVTSDTGELSWLTNTAQTGLVTVDSPRSQALIGFVSAHSAQLRHLTAEVDNRFCTLQLTSLDEAPIATAARLLLVTGARVENTGTSWNMIRTVAEKGGKAPSVIEPVRGRVTLRGLSGATSVTVTALDGAGRPLSDAIPTAVVNGECEFRIGDTVTPWYEIIVGR